MSEGSPLSHYGMEDFGWFSLFDPIDDDSAKRCVEFLIKLDKFSEMEELHLMINSDGGCVHSGLSIIDTMDSCEKPVTTHAKGRVMSMAGLIFICGDHRVIDKNCHFMAHQFSLGMGATKYHELKALRGYEDTMHEQMLNIYTSRTKLSKKKAESILLGHSDSYLTAEQCLEFGIADEIA